MASIKRVSLIGLGAMGSFFAPRLYEKLGENFRVIAGGTRKLRLENQGVTINGTNYRFPVTAPDEHCSPADLIIISVKDYCLDAAIDDIQNQMGENTLILSVLNGIESEDKLIARYGEQHVLYSFMRVSIVMSGGRADFDPKLGAVYFGEKLNDTYSPRVLAVKELFDSCGIPHVIGRDMLHGIWFKYMCNIGENMTCALLGVPFAAFQRSENANFLRRAGMREVLQIAQRSGIALSESDMEKQEQTIKILPPLNRPSTLQDLSAGKKTEIEMFSGTVCRLGKKLNIPTPVNDLFYHGIKALEEKESGKFR